MRQQRRRKRTLGLKIKSKELKDDRARNPMEGPTRRAIAMVLAKRTPRSLAGLVWNQKSRTFANLAIGMLNPGIGALRRLVANATVPTAATSPRLAKDSVISRTKLTNARTTTKKNPATIPSNKRRRSNLPKHSKPPSKGRKLEPTNVHTLPDNVTT